MKLSRSEIRNLVWSTINELKLVKKRRPPEQEEVGEPGDEP